MVLLRWEVEKKVFPNCVKCSTCHSVYHFQPGQHDHEEVPSKAHEVEVVQEQLTLSKAEARKQAIEEEGITDVDG